MAVKVQQRHCYFPLVRTPNSLVFDIFKIFYHLLF